MLNSGELGLGIPLNGGRSRLLANLSLPLPDRMSFGEGSLDEYPPSEGSANDDELILLLFIE